MKQSKTDEKSQFADLPVLTTSRSKFLSWLEGFKENQAAWPFPFGRGCCSLEFLHAFSPIAGLAQVHGKIPILPVDLSNMLFIGGGVNLKSIERVVELHRKMPLPNWVIAIGACSVTGGLFHNSPTHVELDDYLKVDVYIPGCPPTPESIWQGFLRAQKLMVEFHER